MINSLPLVSSVPIQGSLHQTAISEGLLAIESRDGPALFFLVIDHATGKVLHHALASVITPWHSLVAMQDGFLILQHFDNKQNPDEVSMFRYDWLSEELHEYNKPIPSVAITRPGWVPEESSEFETIRQFFGDEPVLGCEYLETDDTIIASYYTRTDGLNRRLKVLKKGEAVLDIVQDSNLKGIAPGCFFTYKNRLIFAHENKEIKVYEI